MASYQNLGSRSYFRTGIAKSPLMKLPRPSRSGVRGRPCPGVPLSVSSCLLFTLDKARKPPGLKRSIESAPEAKPGPVPRYNPGMKAIAVSICALAACLVSGCGNMDMCDTNYT